MAYVISSIETAPQPVYRPKAGASIDAERTVTPSEPGSDFQSLLKQSTMAVPAAAPAKSGSALLGLTATASQAAASPSTATLAAATPVAATATPATATPAAPSGTMGSIMLGSPGPIVNSTPSIPAMAPTAESLFGSNPWINDAGGSGPYGSYNYNKYYFATPATAAKVAAMMGGKVVATNDLTPNGPFVQNQANQMVQMPDGRLINAGIIASYFDHGWSQQSVDQLINGEIAGGPAIAT